MWMAGEGQQRAGSSHLQFPCRAHRRITSKGNVGFSLPWSQPASSHTHHLFKTNPFPPMYSRFPRAEFLQKRWIIFLCIYLPKHGTAVALYLGACQGISTSEPAFVKLLLILDPNETLQSSWRFRLQALCARWAQTCTGVTEGQLLSITRPLGVKPAMPSISLCPICCLCTQEGKRIVLSLPCPIMWGNALFLSSLCTCSLPVPGWQCYCTTYCKDWFKATHIKTDTQDVPRSTIKHKYIYASCDSFPHTREPSNIYFTLCTNTQNIPLGITWLKPCQREPVPRAYLLRGCVHLIILQFIQI